MHAQEEGAGAAGWVANGEFTQSLIKRGSEVVVGNGLVGFVLFVGIRGKDKVVKEAFEAGAEAIDERVYQGEATHEINFNAGGVENAGFATAIRVGLASFKGGKVDEALVNLANHFRVNGNLLVKRR